MQIGLNELRRARYFPEKLLGTAVYALAAGAQAQPPPLDARLFDPLVVRVTDVALAPQAGIEWELTWDTKTIRRTSAALSSTDPSAVDVAAFRQVRLDVVNAGTGTVSDYPVRFGLWVYLPTLAERLHRRQTLSGGDAQLAERLGIVAEVRQRARLPIPIEVLLERETQVLERMTFARTLDVPAGGEALVEQIRPEGPDEALVLEAVAADRGASASANVVLHVDRDGQANYHSILAWCLAGIDRDVSLRIPAVEELRVRLSASADLSGFRVRIVVARVRLSDVWRIRWGLASSQDVPAELWDQVHGGLL